MFCHSEQSQFLNLDWIKTLKARCIQINSLDTSLSNMLLQQGLPSIAQFAPSTRFVSCVRIPQDVCRANMDLIVLFSLAGRDIAIKKRNRVILNTRKEYLYERWGPWAIVYKICMLHLQDSLLPDQNGVIQYSVYRENSHSIKIGLRLLSTESITHFTSRPASLMDKKNLHVLYASLLWSLVLYSIVVYMT